MNHADCHSEIPNETGSHPFSAKPSTNDSWPDDATTNSQFAATSADSREPDGPAYAAFISYRHLPRDAKVAQQVQRAIESYQLPRGARTARGKHRLGKCFRDEDELAASPSLPDSINRALEQSASLVLICSPETQNSPWVRREIETFITLHGRERIVCVLAAGDSASSIPTILKTQLVPDAHGVLREMPAEPLAADLRPEAKAKHKLELLRIIAAVAGRNFDDLRQRERARRRKRLAVAALAAIMALALVGTLAFRAHDASWDALEAESAALAAQSHEQLARGERFQALETALAALPSSGIDWSRPLVPEARIALEEALELYRDTPKKWHPLFSIDTPLPVEQFTAGIMGEWIAVLDDHCFVTVYDGVTAQRLWSIDLRNYTTDTFNMDPDEWKIIAAGRHNFLIANYTGEGCLAAFEAKSGTELWRQEECLASGIALDETGYFAAVFSVLDDGSMLFGLFDTETGEVLSWCDTPPSGFRRNSRFFATAISIESGFAAVSNGNFALCIHIEDGDYTITPLDNNYGHSPNTLWSLALAENYLVGASFDTDYFSDTMNTDRAGIDLPYLIGSQLLSSTKAEHLWDAGGTYSYNTSNTTGQPISYDGNPRIHGFVKDKELAALCSAGRVLSVRACDNGEELYREEFHGSIVTAQSVYFEHVDEDLHPLFYFVTSDGTIESRLLSTGTESVDSLRCVIPYQVDDAQIITASRQGITVIAHAANQPTRLIAYHYPNTGSSQKSPESYTLDELIAQAREILDAR
ncbi:MAG: TIR domain-containing protein [Adlercreutzia sp.]|nr:TIR domain-containing protein [Adlercreutzia sp.]